MASTPQGDALTNAHRGRQIRLRALTDRDLLQLWRLYDPANPASWARLEPMLVELIQSRRQLSAALTREYLRQYAIAETGVAAQAVTGATHSVTLTAEEIVGNLRLLGPNAAARLEAQGRTAAQIVSTVFSNIEGEVTRQTLNGGRQALLDGATADRRIHAYTRVTDGSPCAFCALLAGRGPVYRTAFTAGFEAHRKCGCTGEPAYNLDTYRWPPSAERWADLYDEVAADVRSGNVPGGRSSKNVRREFRRRYDAARKPPT